MTRRRTRASRSTTPPWSTGCCKPVPTTRPWASCACRWPSSCRAAASALERGGVHTPNHRWEMTAALCRLQAVLPGVDLQQRIEDWLAEGIDIDADGLYSERSPNYAVPRIEPVPAGYGRPARSCRPDRVGPPQPARPDRPHRPERAGGDRLLPTAGSERRLSSGAVPDAVPPLRRRRVHRLCLDGSGGVERPRCGRSGCRRPTVRGPPARERTSHRPHPSSRPERRLFAEVRLLRDRRGRAITTVLWRLRRAVHRAHRIGTGLQSDFPALAVGCGQPVTRCASRGSSSASARSGARASRSARRAPGCRNASPLPTTSRCPSSVAAPTGVTAWSTRAGSPRRCRSPSGTAISSNSPPRSSSLPRQDALELTAKFAGVATSYAFELCFRPGGEFGGVEQLGPDSYLLVEGEGSYRVGEDAIVFGPGGGSGPQQPAHYDPGEAYTFLSGTDALTWPRVYITGRTPGITQITLRGQSAYELPVSRHSPQNGRRERKRPGEA